MRCGRVVANLPGEENLGRPRGDTCPRSRPIILDACDRTNRQARGSAYARRRERTRKNSAVDESAKRSKVAGSGTKATVLIVPKILNEAPSLSDENKKSPPRLVDAPGGTRGS